jgi:hypothetical protein
MMIFRFDPVLHFRSRVHFYVIIWTFSHTKRAPCQNDMLRHRAGEEEGKDCTEKRRVIRCEQSLTAEKDWSFSMASSQGKMLLPVRD